MIEEGEQGDISAASEDNQEPSSAPLDQSLTVAAPRLDPSEPRVALDPEATAMLVAAGWSVRVECGLGQGIGLSDDTFAGVGATIGNRADTLRDADVVVAVGCPPDPSELSGGSLIGMLAPLEDPVTMRALAGRGVNAFSLDILPRQSRAVIADAASSQGTIAGYRAGTLAAMHLERVVPLLVTPAGSLPAAKALIVGTGPVALQAALTLRRMGADVEVYDPRASMRELVESLGVRFLGGDLSTGPNESRPSRAEAARRQQSVLASHAAAADIVILAATSPGRAAPKLLPVETVSGMRPGSVILDLAAPTGGNCALTRGGDVITHDGVVIIGAGDLARDLPRPASRLYSRNVSHFLRLLVATGKPPRELADADDIVRAACVTFAGAIVHEPTRSRLGLTRSAAPPTARSATPITEPAPVETPQPKNDDEEDRSPVAPTSSSPLVDTPSHEGNHRGWLNDRSRRGSTDVEPSEPIERVDEAPAQEPPDRVPEGTLHSTPTLIVSQADVEERTSEIDDQALQAHEVELDQPSDVSASGDTVPLSADDSFGRDETVTVSDVPPDDEDVVSIQAAPTYPDNAPDDGLTEVDSDEVAESAKSNSPMTDARPWRFGSVAEPAREPTIETGFDESAVGDQNHDDETPVETHDDRTPIPGHEEVDTERRRGWGFMANQAESDHPTELDNDVDDHLEQDFGRAPNVTESEPAPPENEEPPRRSLFGRAPWDRRGDRDGGGR